MKARRIAIGLVGTLAGGWVVQPALAEQPSAPPRGNIVGVVQEAGGAPVSDAAIEALDEKGQVVRSTRTSRAGGYEIPCLAEGEYRLRLDSQAGRHQGQKVVAPVTRDGLRVDWTVARDKPALAQAKPGGGACAAAGTTTAETTTTATTTTSGETVAVGAAGGAVVIGGTVGGLAASGAFEGGSSGSPSQ